MCLHSCNESHYYIYLECVFLTEKCKQCKGSTRGFWKYCTWKTGTSFIWGCLWGVKVVVLRENAVQVKQICWSLALEDRQACLLLLLVFRQLNRYICICAEVSAKNCFRSCSVLYIFDGLSAINLYIY